MIIDMTNLGDVSKVNAFPYDLSDELKERIRRAEQSNDENKRQWAEIVRSIPNQFIDCGYSDEDLVLRSSEISKKMAIFPHIASDLIFRLVEYGRTKKISPIFADSMSAEPAAEYLKMMCRLPLIRVLLTKDSCGLYGKVESYQGVIISGMITTQCLNPIFLINAIDEEASAEVKCILKNTKYFEDNYLGFPVDISRCIFVISLSPFSEHTFKPLHILRRYDNKAVKDKADELMKEFKCSDFVEFTEDAIELLVRYCNSVKDDICSKLIKIVLCYACFSKLTTDEKIIINATEVEGIITMEVFL